MLRGQVVYAVMVAVLAIRGSEAWTVPELDLHPLPFSEDVIPECTSNGRLCDISFGFGEPAEMLPNSGPMCACPNNVTCPVDVDDPARVHTLELMSSFKQTTTVRLSYCRPTRLPTRKCNFGDIVLATEGTSPFAFKIIGGPKCRCPKPLTLHSARPHGLYTVQHYSCGKPICRINKSTAPACELRSSLSSPAGPPRVASKVLCLCPPGFTCTQPAQHRRMLSYGRKEVTCTQAPAQRT